MCAQCVAQGAAYLGVGVAGLRAASWRARTRATTRAARSEGPDAEPVGQDDDAPPRC